MFECNTGLDCNDCVGCETELTPNVFSKFAVIGSEIFGIFSDNYLDETFDVVSRTQWIDTSGKYHSDFISCKSVNYSDVVEIDSNLEYLKHKYGIYF